MRARRALHEALVVEVSAMRRQLAIALALGLGLLGSPSAVRAEATPPTDCPPGAVGKASGEFGWCEPTICENDAQCTPRLCRTVKLCVEIGKVTSDGGPKLSAQGAGVDRLVATGLCVGADKACPGGTICSEKKRCLDRSQAERMNLLEEPKPAPSMGGTAEPVKKSSCSCELAGASAQSHLSTACALVIAAALLQRARRRS
jgi:hypothetical protein